MTAIDRSNPYVALPNAIAAASPEFVDAYEVYVDSLYSRQYVPELHAYLRRLGVNTILDCAAGIGFPALDLLRRSEIDGSSSFSVVHCTDGDSEMIARLRKRAVGFGMIEKDLEPSLEHETPDPMVLQWAQLSSIVDQYDYVMCRGNSLVYYGTWGGGDQVASELLIEEAIALIAQRVAPGGYLHIDGPRGLIPPSVGPDDEGNHRGPIDELVVVEEARRRWEVSIAVDQGRGSHTATRYSAKLSVDDLEIMLCKRNPEFTIVARNPFAHERAAFGVVVAQRQPHPVGKSA